MGGSSQGPGRHHLYARCPPHLGGTAISGHGGQSAAPRSYQGAAGEPSDTGRGTRARQTEGALVKNWAAKVLLFVIASILLSTPALPRSARSTPKARSTRSYTRSTPKARSTRNTTRSSRSTRCISCARDSQGKSQRSAIAKRAFRQSHPCPSTGRTSGACSGYVIDHVKALKHGGADEPGNMQWQTTAAAKAKDRVE
jgi:hypothetical protein